MVFFLLNLKFFGGIVNRLTTLLMNTTIHFSIMFCVWDKIFFLVWFYYRWDVDIKNLPDFLSSSPSRPRNNLEIAETDGAEERSQIPSLTRRSRISHENIPGFSRLYSSMRDSTSGVATRGLEPPMTPGRIDPVS